VTESHSPPLLKERIRALNKQYLPVVGPAHPALAYPQLHHLLPEPDIHLFYELIVVVRF